MRQKYPKLREERRERAAKRAEQEYPPCEGCGATNLTCGPECPFEQVPTIPKDLADAKRAWQLMNRDQRREFVRWLVDPDRKPSA